MIKPLLPPLLRTLMLAAALCGATPLSRAAGVDPVLDSAWQRVQTVATQGSDDLFASGYIWHDPHTYTAAKRAQLNSEGWGGGWGRHLATANGEDMVYAIAFLDSHRNVEPVVGYARQWQWSWGHGPVFGLGYTAGLTSRADIANNLPFPIVLPLASVGSGRFKLYGTFIPRLNGLPNNGNVAFFFARYSFGG